MSNEEGRRKTKLVCTLKECARITTPDIVVEDE
jgi:hypothetical protein